MAVDRISEFYKSQFETLGKFDTSSGTYTSGTIVSFAEKCKKTKVDVDDILANLIIAKPDNEALGYTDSEVEKNKRFEEVLKSFPMKRGQSFDSSASRDEKIAWVMKHLSTAEKIAVLSEVQAIESLSGNSNSEFNPYPNKITKAKMSKGASKKDCINTSLDLKNNYKNLLLELKSKIAELEASIADKQKAVLEASRGNPGMYSEAVVLDSTKEQIEKLNKAIEDMEKEVAELRQLYSDMETNLEVFNAAIDEILRANKIVETEETKETEKTEDKSSGQTIKSPYSSLSDRGKQAADSEEAKDLFQSFSDTDQVHQFLMITGPNAHNMMAIARNLSKVSERQQLQKYCEELINSSLLKTKKGSDKYIEAFTIKINGKVLNFPQLYKPDLVAGLQSGKIEELKEFYTILNANGFKGLSAKQIDQLQNYSNALLLSTVLQESKWSIGGQIRTGLLNIKRKNTPTFDLGKNVAAFTRPIGERKDSMFKQNNDAVDRGILSSDHVVHSQKTWVSSGHRQFEAYHEDR